MIKKLNEMFITSWITCRIVSDKRSVQYGIYFSYPIYILIVLTGILLENPYILLITALIAFASIKLPMHLFDYMYNYGIAKILGTNKIPGRGSELQVNSTVALIFSLVVFTLMIFEISISYLALAIIYTIASVFFIGIFFFKG